MTPEDVAAMAWSGDYRGSIGVFQWDLAAGRRAWAPGTRTRAGGRSWTSTRKGQGVHAVESDSFRGDPDAGEQQIDRPGEWTRTTAINAAGEVVGASGTADREGSRAFVWDPDTGITLVGPPGSGAEAINE